MCSHSSCCQISKKISRPNINHEELPQQWRKMDLTGCKDWREAGAACMPPEVTTGPFLCPHPMAFILPCVRALPVSTCQFNTLHRKRQETSWFSSQQSHLPGQHQSRAQATGQLTAGSFRNINTIVVIIKITVTTSSQTFSSKGFPGSETKTRLKLMLSKAEKFHPGPIHCQH